MSSSPPDELARYFAAAPPEESASDGAPQAPAAASGSAPAAGEVGSEVASRGPAAAGSEPLGGVGPNFNVAPSTDVYAVFADGETRRLDAFHWGLVPSWAKDISVGNRMINARSETLLSSNAYKRPFVRRRCIIPADGFYEWTAVPGHRKKQPYYIHRRDGEPLAFAGLWEVWRVPKDRRPDDGDEAERSWLRSCTIITTSANDAVASLHDRMPVILPPSAWAEWLDPDNDDTAALGRLLIPAPNDLLVMHPVSTEVNNVRNQGAHLIDPVTAIDPDGKEAEAGAQQSLAVGGRSASRSNR